MTLDKGMQLLKGEAAFSGFYNANGGKPIPPEVQREHGQPAVDQSIRELD